ncbi:F-box domain-containing protein [Mycena chlorophos]|uniref:F-box domain-containing protein n=1 Tax=Mycena chlorophos TaxID=658473 RepID=A0A8H6S028_MYCCL|nr:F-box domain-containing protein [Mycena chlorophos]
MEFPHLSSTNHVPLEAESQHIRALVETAEEEQNRVRQELDETRAKERKLVERDDALTERIRSLKAIVSATRRMPPEILSNIFLLATQAAVEQEDRWEVDLVDSEGDLEWDDTRGATNARAFLRLSQVSSRWRAVAQTTSLLWRTLRFDLGPYCRLRGDGVVSLIMHFAHLSQPYGLQLAFKSHKQYTRGMPLAVLWSCGHQLASLELKVPGSLLAPLLGLPSRTFHKLKRLEINLYDGTDSGLLGDIPGLASAQHLEDLKLVMRSTTSAERLLPAPNSSSWNTLRTLDICSHSGLNLGGVYLSLQSCHSLQQLALSMEEVDDLLGPEARIKGVLRLEQLVSFTLQIDYGLDDEMAPFITMLFAPQLTALSLKGSFLVGAVVEFLEHSNKPPISTLRLESCVREDTDLRGALLNVLRCVPLVETLALGLQLSPGVDDTFLRALTILPGGSDTSEVFLPAMRTLDIAKCAAPLTARAAADMVESRQVLHVGTGLGNGGHLPGRCLTGITLSGPRLRRGWMHDGAAWSRIAALEGTGILHFSSSS